MKKPIILFIQGGGKDAYEVDKELTLYLQYALGKLYVIRYPKMPKEHDPDYGPWKIKFHKEFEKIHGKVFLVGHSIGSYLLLKFLSTVKIERDIAGMFFIATPFLGEDGWQYEGMELEKDFASKLPDAPAFFYHSTDDEIVPFSHLGLYSKKLTRATIRKIVGRGHQFNNDLSEVVEDIKKLGQI